MDDKKRKTGIGEPLDAFFQVRPPAVQEAQRDKKKSPKEQRKVKSKPKAPPKAPKERPQAEPQATQDGDQEMEKVSLLLSLDKLEQLEELKQQERKRLRQAGEKNWRRQVSVSNFITQAIDDFLVKKRGEGGSA